MDSTTKVYVALGILIGLSSSAGLKRAIEYAKRHPDDEAAQYLAENCADFLATRKQDAA